MLQLAVSALSNLPGGDRLADRTKYQHKWLIVSFGIVACLVSVVGIYQNDQQRKQTDLQNQRDREDAAKQVAAATERALAADIREKQMQESLLGLGIGLGLNQQAAMLVLCPPPISTTDGSEEGNTITTYKVLHYEKVDLWFSYPVGRYVDAQIGDRAISTKRAVQLNPCLATVLHLPKPPVTQLKQPDTEQEPTDTKEPQHGNGDGAGAVIGFAVIVGLLYLFFGRKKES